VNQLLAKMDGVAPLVVPTLVIGLTNRRSLIDKALLRPGRFEVHIEVPPPRTIEQRVSILNIHMRHMYSSGRLLVRDAPVGSSAAAAAVTSTNDPIPTYDELLESLATMCDGFSGASLAAVTRAAASHALERSVEDFATHLIPATTSTTTTQYRSLLTSCIVTKSDLQLAIQDVRTGHGDADWTGDDNESAKTEAEESSNGDSSNEEEQKDT
jgi:SpoVK/Ycf46/Vps4 family AAA+-type ATPase